MIQTLTEMFQEEMNSKDPLLNWKKRFWDRFMEVGLPDKKSEGFRYLGLEKLEVFPSMKESLSLSSIPKEMVKLPLSLAIRSYGIFLQNRFTHRLKEEKDPFALLNGAIANGGIFLYVPPKVAIEEPLILRASFPKGNLATERIYLYLGKEASLTIKIEVEGEGFFNFFFDATLDVGAKLSFIETSKPSQEAFCFSSYRVSCKERSSFFWGADQFGSSVSRTSIEVELLGVDARAKLMGLSRLSLAKENHIHAAVFHRAERTMSRQHFKAVLEDQSSFSFEGKIFVEKEAQKTESYQLCNQLLLSDEAKSRTKPNLEIFADDVKASHGATIGAIDPEILFYLESRGLSYEESRSLWIGGFCEEILAAL